MNTIYLILITISVELLLLILVRLLKKNFQWIINHEDEFPITDSEKLDLFFKKKLFCRTWMGSKTWNKWN